MAETGLTDTQAVAVHGLSVRYGRTEALREVSLQFTAGCMHALVGANGAGKSSLLAALMGNCRPSAGELHILGAKVGRFLPGNPSRRGMAWMRQQGTLLPQLSVLANFALADTGWGKIAWSRLRRQVSAQLQKVGLELDPAVRVEELSLSQRQLVEFARLQWRSPRLILLDEPSAQMGAADAQRLMEMLQQNVAAGQTVIITDHRLDEVYQWAEQIHVLRQGTLVLSAPRAELTKPQLLQAMFAGKVSFQATARRSTGTATMPQRRAVLEIRGLRRCDWFDHPFELQVAAGEIVGLVGPPDQGFTRLMATLCGREEEAHEVAVTINGRSCSRRNRYTCGVRSIPAQIEDACAMQMTIAENLLLHQRRATNCLRSGGLFINWPQVSRMAAQVIDSEQLAVPYVSHLLAWLSGGNQRKLLIARELHEQGSVVVAQNIDAGLDLRSIQSLADRLGVLREKGVAVLLIADDCSFVRAIADRVCVWEDGKLNELDCNELLNNSCNQGFLAS